MLNRLRRGEMYKMHGKRRESDTEGFPNRVSRVDIVHDMILQYKGC